MITQGLLCTHFRTPSPFVNRHIARLCAVGDIGDEYPILCHDQRGLYISQFTYGYQWREFGDLDLSHVFADLKFMAIFSMLFGAGVILATQRRDQAGQRTWTYHYARTFWLLIFGMIHAYFFGTGTYWSPMRCADLWSIGFAISLPPHSFHRGHFPVDCAVDYDVGGCRAR